MSRYPRRCCNGHEMLGPDDEACELNRRGKQVRRCRMCRREAQARYALTGHGAAAIERKRVRRVESGAHAESVARSSRRRAEITRTGIETKTKNADTETKNPTTKD